MKKKRTTVYVPPVLFEDIKLYCVKNKTNFSGLVTNLLKLLLDNEKISQIDK